MPAGEVHAAGPSVARGFAHVAEAEPCLAVRAKCYSGSLRAKLCTAQAVHRVSISPFTVLELRVTVLALRCHCVGTPLSLCWQSEQVPQYVTSASSALNPVGRARGVRQGISPTTQSTAIVRPQLRQITWLR